MLNCDEVTNLCSAELERPLSLWEGMSLKMHLMTCKGCSNYRLHMRFLRAAMHRYAEGRAVTGTRDGRDAT